MGVSRGENRFFAASPQRGAFWLDPWSRDQGLTGSTLPAWWFRPHASYLRKEARCRASAKKLPKGTPWKGFLWTLPETEGPRSLRLPGAARYRDFPSRALLRTFERSLVGGTTNLADPTWRKANFLWKFLCAGGASLDYGGDPIPTAVPPQGFLQSKNTLRRRKTVGLLLGSLVVEYPVNWNAIADQSESAGKNRRSARQDSSCQLEPLGSHKGPQTLVLCCAASATKAISSRRLDTALLCAAKKRGVETTRLAGHCQFDPGACRHGKK